MTRAAGPYKLHNPWKLIAIAVVGAALTIGFALGFLVLPRFQQTDAPRSTWDTICSALGFNNWQWATTGTPPVRTPSDVVWTDASVKSALAGNAERGEFIAVNCSACHGAQGLSKQPWVPSLAGMDKLAIVKQLKDFHSGKRLWGVMNGIAQSLSEADYADVAAYYAALQPGLIPTGGERVPRSGRSLNASDRTARLVFGGDPANGVAPCSACHGPGGYHLGAPSLAGQHSAYVQRQLGEFVQGLRANDIDEPMRTIAARLTDEEVQSVATYYGSLKDASSKADHNIQPANLSTGEPAGRF